METDWARMFAEHNAAVYRFLLFFTGNREEAEDLTQETFLRAFRSNGDRALLAGETDRPVRPLLLTIARHLAIDRFRRQQHQRRALFRLRGEALSTPADEGRDFTTDHLDSLHHAIRALKPNYRAVTMLRGIEQFSVAETAAILGWTETKTKVSYHRALKQLRTLLDDELGKGGWGYGWPSG